MQSKYSITTKYITDNKSIEVTNTSTGKVITYIATEESDQNQLEFIKANNLQDSVIAMGTIDGNESLYQLNQTIPYVIIRDYSSTSNVKIRSYLCVSHKRWEYSLIHYDSRSAFKCILEKLNSPSGLIICENHVK